MFKRLIFILGFCFFVLSANAGPRADQLYWSCTAKQDSPKAMLGKMFCVGYLSGMVDSYTILSSLSKKIRAACLPRRGVSNDQVLRLYVQWINKNPKDMHLSARSVFLFMLKDAFPCK